MTISTTDAYQALLQAWPQGLGDYMDLSPSGDMAKFLRAQAVLVAARLNAVETLRLELNPATMVEKIADWEAACGLTQTTIAQIGGVEQRRAQVLAVLRAFGSSFSIPEIQAIAQPFLQYDDPTEIEILEADRNALDDLHTYLDSTTWTLPSGSANNTASGFRVLDDGTVSPSGPRVVLNLTAYLEEIAVALYAPDGSTYVWPKGYLGTGSVTAETYYLFAPTLAGVPILGGWTVVVSGDGTHTATVNSTALVVEGLGRDARGGNGLAAAMFEWAVVVDPAKVGPNADIDALLGVLRRVKPAHTSVAVIKMNAVVGGGLAAIPDEPETIPDACVPGV